MKRPGRLGISVAVGVFLAIGLLIPPAAQAATPVRLSDAVHTLAAQRGQVGVQAICTANVVIQSAANGNYSSTELGFSGGDHAMLRARSSTIGPWELYTLCTDGTVSWFTSQANNRVVAAELGYSGGDYAMLRARSTSVGIWERFIIEDLGGAVAIKSSANNRYVAAELGYSGSSYGELRARSASIGPWEIFA